MDSFVYLANRVNIAQTKNFPPSQTARLEKVAKWQNNKQGGNALGVTQE
jgi:hypothetical protein